MTRYDVAALMGVPLYEVTWWVYALRPGRRYERFEIARRGGGAPRQIKSPIKPIKDMQRVLAQSFAACYEPPPNVHGFVYDRSPRSNAWVHQRQHWLLKVDIEDFFPSINFGRVRGLFMAFPFDYPEDVATLLAQICCYENQLPQGAPTSPVISNFICRRLDVQLASLARDERCYYSRYADDICFSTNRRSFPPALAATAEQSSVALGQPLATIIEGNGFVPNREKTRLVRTTQRQRVTGLVVNAKVNIDRRYIRDLRNLLYIWRRYGETAASEAFARVHAVENRPPAMASPQLLHVIQGRVQHVGSVRGWADPVYRRLVAGLQAVDQTFQPTTLRPPETSHEIYLLTEGESDCLHLLAAKEYFARRHEFEDLRLNVDANSSTGSDQTLLRTAGALARVPHATPRVCIFDADNEELLRKAMGSAEYKRLDNRVIVMAIGTPKWRGRPLCIEMLYTDEDLKRRDSNGRRLYLSEEFDARTTHHLTERVAAPNRSKRSLVQEDVFDRDDGLPVGLQKLQFAKYVNDKHGDFAHVTFEGFRRTFEIMREAVNRDGLPPE